MFSKKFKALTGRSAKAAVVQTKLGVIKRQDFSPLDGDGEREHRGVGGGSAVNFELDSRLIPCPFTGETLLHGDGIILQPGASLPKPDSPGDR